jgi:hypothetical protein
MMREFLWGALAMGCATIGLLFLRFWRESLDRLFVFFALGFGALALNWTGLAFSGGHNEARHYYFMIRLLAFVLIIAGIIDKNRKSLT